MEIIICELPSVSIIGMEGGAEPGHNPAPALWEQANARFSEVEALALRDENGAVQTVNNVSLLQEEPRRMPTFFMVRPLDGE